MKNIVTTSEMKCRECYSCVRNCPVKAVRVKNGQAEVIYDRCLNCGNCVRVCSQNAKVVRDGLSTVKNWLKKGEKVILILAPGFPAAFPEEKNLLKEIKRTGFSEVWEVSLGAQLISFLYKDLIRRKINFQPEPIISSACPVIENLITKHYPNLKKYLAPIDSPMTALAKFIHWFKKAKVKVVFAGPCIAKKQECGEDMPVQEVITFKELKELLVDKELFSFADHFDKEIEGRFDGYSPDPVFKTFALSGGMMKSIELEMEIAGNNQIVEGIQDSLELLNSLSGREGEFYFFDVLFCRGCIDGPVLAEENLFLKKKRVWDFYQREKEKSSLSAPEIPEEILKKALKELNFTREFSVTDNSLPLPSEEDIKNILKMTGKIKPEDELNCGACGYPTCRKKAEAVFQGIAEVEMCLPYLLNEARENFKLQKELHQELESILASSFDGILVTDGDGNTRHLNRAYAEMLNLKEDEINGFDEEKFAEKGIIQPAITTIIKREKRAITLLQKVNDNKKILVTGKPTFDEQGKLSKIVVNARDLSQLKGFGKELKEFTKLKKFIENKEASTSKVLIPEEKSPFVAFSNPMEKVLNLAQKVARVNSTVFIQGESGVGKGVVARIIHDLSERSNRPFVAINCGAIPETLLESELFGYETGAFTGAKTKGKPGLIETAQGGTVFLDEISEIPTNLQVKLLQVIQEKKVVRIGGVRPVFVDVRFIAATNQNIEKMVKEGTFREDLFYRLNVIPLKIPPLRERIEDIVPLTNHFLEKYNQKYNEEKDLSREAKNALKKYHWPGNCRELENVIERLVVTCEKDLVEVEDLPANIREQMPSMPIEIHGFLPLKQAREIMEKILLLKAKKKAKTGSTYEMARLLGIDQSTVVRKWQKYFSTDD